MAIRTARLDAFIDINPRTPVQRGAECEFVEMADITPGRRYVRAEQTRACAGSGSKFLSGDTLMARITPCLENGKIAQFISNHSAVAQGSTEFWVFRAKENISDSTYVFYLACTQAIRGAAEKSMAGASGRQRADVDSVRAVEVPAPSIEHQRRITSILSAYDDLIENNTRRIAILEEMALRIYEEWFVHFRFPGHENARMIESELGLVPEEWSLTAASAAIHVNPQTKVPKDGLKPFVAMNCLVDGSMLIGAPEQRSGNSGSKFRNGDTLFARITPCLENGKTGFVQFLPNDDFATFGSTEFIVLRSRTLTPEFVYLLARSKPFRDNAIKSMSGASGRQRVRDACFDSFLLPQPDATTLRSFAENVRPMFRLIQTLAMKNANLSTTRDLLLPKLISGEMDVSAIPEPETAAA